MERGIPGVKLEEQYTWEELSKLFADRIEENNFVEKKKWNRKKFIEWFLLRKDVGLRFDWRMVARCYVIWKSLQEEHDHFTVVVGIEGSGKTTFATQIASWVAPNMELNDLVFDINDYIKKLQDISKNYRKNKVDHNDKSVIIDEGGISLFSREAMSLSNKLLAKTFMVQRFLNVHVTICIPYYWSLDPLIRNHRINTLVMISERGKYKCTAGKGIKILNRGGLKDKDKPLFRVPVPYGMFWEGNFHKDFPNTISLEEYEKHKFKHVKKFIDEVKIDAQAIKMIKVARLEKEFGLHRDTIISQIHSGEIEGKKIGSQWFITQKAYEKLLKVN